MHGLHRGLIRVGDVLLGCVVGLLVSLAMSKLWPLANSRDGSPTR